MLTKNRRRALASLLAVSLIVGVTQAFAMGTGNPYAEAQVGLNYVVYQPSYLSHLSLKSNTLIPNCHKGADDSFVATYGSSKKFFTITETSSKSICAQTMMLIRGTTRTALGKPGVGRLTGAEVIIISVGLPRVEIKKIFAGLKPKYNEK